MSLPGRSHPLRGFVLLSLVGAVALAFGASVARAATHHQGGGGKHARKPVGFVYTETNATPNNQVLIFRRYANGRLKWAGAVSTGGSGGQQPQPTPAGPCGAPPDPSVGCPFLDAQSEVVLAPDGKLLFVVNAGSNNITSFQVTKWGLRKVSVIDSGGEFPNSLTVHGNVLYVLNSNSDNIAGFRFSHSGTLTAIAGSTQPLIGAIRGLPRQIGFDASGELLMVTLLANAAGPPPVGGTANTIDTFPVHHGVAGAATAHDSTSPFPFGFAFDSHGHAVMSQINRVLPPPGPGTAQTYSVTNATMTPISGLSTNAFAPCWVEITHNQRYTYVVNTGGGAPGTVAGTNIAEYKLSTSGTLTLIGNTAPVFEFAKTDEAVTPDDRYLYVVSPRAAGPTTPPQPPAPGPSSLIDVYAINRAGTLRFVASTPDIPSPGLSGLAVS